MRRQPPHVRPQFLQWPAVSCAHCDSHFAAFCENTAIGTTWSTGYGVLGENVITVMAIDEAGNRSVAGTTRLTIPF